MGDHMTPDVDTGSNGAPGVRRGVRPLVWVRGLRTVLWLLVFTGPALAILALVHASDLADQLDLIGRTPAVEPSADTGPVEGFAELYLASYLGSTPDDSAVAGDLAAGEGAMHEGDRRVIRTVSLGAERVDDGYYAVTVAVEVRAGYPDSDPVAGVAAGMVIYRVGVVATDTGWSTVGPPALIPVPVTGPTPDLLVGRMEGLDEVPGLEETVLRFLSAYMAGDGELTRYLAPGSQLTPVLPPPLSTVELVDAGSTAVSDSAREVVVVVEGVDDSGRGQVLQFGLIVALRDGRWEVAELLPGPSLSQGNP
jgi:hypothetical protein